MLTPKEIKKPMVSEKLIKISKAKNRKWDIAFWQSQTAEARFSAGWQMVVNSYLWKGIKVNARTFRLQKHVESFRKI